MQAERREDAQQSGRPEGGARGWERHRQAAQVGPCADAVSHAAATPGGRREDSRQGALHRL